MGTVNNGKVVVSGLIAGLVMTISQLVLNEIVLVDANAEVFEAMNLPEPGGAMIGLFIALTFVVAIAMMWLYAVMRSHSGPGPKTAACAGAFMWFAYMFLPNTFLVIMGMFPLGTMVVAWVWGLVEMTVAAVAGAKFYSD